ncbi:hypothetical protein D3C75_1326470 [compost metagenome]
MILGRVGGSFREGNKCESAPQVAVEFVNSGNVIFGLGHQACLCSVGERAGTIGQSGRILAS